MICKKLISFLLLTAWVCPGSWAAKEPARIYGNIIHTPSKRIILNYGRESDTALIRDNHFTFQVSLPEAMHAEIIDDNTIYPVYLSPGDSLLFSVDRAKPLETWKCSGRGALYNNAIIEMIKKNASIAGQLTPVFKLDKWDFLRTMDSISLLLQKYFMAYCKEKKITRQDFILLEKQRIRYSVASQKFLYPSYYPRLTGKEFNDSGYFYFLDTMPQVIGSMLAIPECRQYVTMMLDHLVNYHKDSFLAQENQSIDRIRMQIISDFFFDENVRNYLYFHTLKGVIYTFSLTQIQEIIGFFETECTDSLYKAQIRSFIAQKQSLVPGRPAPEFECYDSAGKIVRLSDFRGKLVYIDFWATWCAPCRNELPHLEKIKARYRDSALVVVSISLDETYERWIKTYRKAKLTGIQLYSGDGFYSKVARDYFISSIPLFVLLDREGMIIRFPAPRPSSQGLVELIDKHLKLSAF